MFVKCFNATIRKVDEVLNVRIISKHEIQALFLSRWDVEVSIQEIKTIMDVNILRSKTPEMALKEMTVSLATYKSDKKNDLYKHQGDAFFPQ